MWKIKSRENKTNCNVTYLWSWDKKWNRSLNKQKHMQYKAKVMNLTKLKLDIYQYLKIGLKMGRWPE